MNHYLNHPEELEVPPKSVKFEPGLEYHVPKVNQTPTQSGSTLSA